MNELSAFTPPPNPGDTLRRVLVIKLGAMGDFMQALGAMRVVRATHPSARITLLTTEPFAAFAKACPYFDIVESDGRPRDLKGRSDLIRRLRAANYDMVYDFQNNDRTAQYFAGLSGKKPLWSGAANGASHQHKNPNRAAMHNFDRLAEQLRHAGLEPKPPGDPSGWIEGHDILPHLDWIRPAFRDPPRFQPEFFSLHGPYMLLIPGSSADHPEKRWPIDRFVKLAKWFADMGVTPVVVGAKAEGDIGATIVKAEQRAKNIIGRTDLLQLATLAERAVLAVGGDTGPMHLAAAARNSRRLPVRPGVEHLQGDGADHGLEPADPAGAGGPPGRADDDPLRRHGGPDRRARRPAGDCHARRSGGGQSAAPAPAGPRASVG